MKKKNIQPKTFYEITFGSLNKTLFICFILLSIFASLVIGSLCTINLKNNSISELNVNNLSLSKIISKNIALTENLSKHEDVRYNLKQLQNTSHIDKIDIAQQLSSMFEKYAASSVEISDISIYTHLSDELSFKTIHPIPSQDASFATYLSDNTAVFLDEFSYSNLSLARIDKEKMAIIYPILDHDNTNLGYICTSLSKDAIFNTLLQYNSGKTEYYVINNANKIVMSESLSFLGMDFDAENITKYSSSGTDIDTFNNDLSFVAYSNQNEFSWKIVSVTPFFAAFNWLIILLLVTMFVIFLGYSLCTFVSRRLASYYTKPLNLLLQAIQSKKPVVYEAYSETEEIVNLFSDYNAMLQYNAELFESIEKKTKQNMELEIKSLLTQINPHFLHNTLNAIMWKAVEIDDMELISMISKLGKFCQINYRYDSSSWTLREELSHVNLYLDLQKLCFKNDFTYNIAADNECCDYEVPRFLLQPLVENSIIHGFSQSFKENHILISVRKEENNLLITIEDNGRGIEPDILDSLNDCTYHSNRFGVYNVSKRIKLFYGEEYGITYSSKANLKTVTTLKLGITQKKTQEEK